MGTSSWARVLTTDPPRELQVPRASVRACPTVATPPDPVLSASYLLESNSLLQAPGLCVTSLLQLYPVALQLLALLRDAQGLRVP